MSERSEAVEEQAVRDAAAVYSVELEISATEDVPPGYKRTEVGVMPEDWGIGCLGDFYEIKSSKRVLQRDWRRYGVPFYRTREVAVLAEAGHVDNVLHISEELYAVYAKKYGVPKPGDVLVTGIGTIGKMYVVPNDRKFYFKDASIIWLKSRQSFDSSYLKQLFETHIIRDQLADASTGTTVDTYTISGANKTVVPVPHIKEQRAIATALSDVDALIESLDRLIAKKRAIKQATMQQLLTGQTRLPGFTGEWETKRLGDVADIEMGQSPSSKFYNRNGEGLPLIQGNADIVDRRTIRRISTTQVTKRGQRGDVLLSVRAPVGEVSRATFDVCLGRGVCALRFPNDFLFHYLVFIEPSWAKHSKGSTFDSVSSADIRGLEMEFPGAEEQTAIAIVLSDMDTEIEALERRRDKARQIKQGMMQQLLTGRVRLVTPGVAA